MLVTVSHGHFLIVSAHVCKHKIKKKKVQLVLKDFNNSARWLKTLAKYTNNYFNASNHIIYLFFELDNLVTSFCAS